MNEWTSENFRGLIKTDYTGLAYFYTPLCGTCQVASRMLEISSELLPSVSIGKMDLNYMPDLGEELGIESVPCLLLIKDGDIKHKIYAFHSIPFLLEKIKEVLH